MLAEDSVAAQFATIAGLAAHADVIVAATALQMAARSAAEVHGIPYVFLAYSPVVLPSRHHAPPPLPPIPGQAEAPPPADHAEAWARDAARFTALFGRSLNVGRQRLGLAPEDDVRGHIFGESPWLAADAALAPWDDPQALSVFQPGAFMGADDRPLPPELVTFLDAGDPPIYFGFGSMSVSPALGDPMVMAARALGRRAILSSGWAGLTATAATDFLVIREVNQQALFPRVAAVVHHGGAGTTTVSAMAGTSQVVVPQIYDQHYFAARVADLGIGVAHAPGEPTTDTLTAALSRALDPAIADAARAFAPRIARDGALAAARAILALNRNKGRRREM